jgi:hypothetical protein
MIRDGVRAISDIVQRRLALFAALLLCTGGLGLAFGAVSSSAFEGPFCENVGTSEGYYCESTERSDIRRAIGHVEDAWAKARITAGGETAAGECYGGELGCQANSGYLAKDGTGHGYIYNLGPNGKKATYGYLYP